MNRLLLALLLAIIVATPAWAAVIHDPWLARLQVGEMRAPDDVGLTDDGWPEGLFQPLTVDPGWMLGASRYFGPAIMPRSLDHIGWRLALTAAGGAEPAQRRYTVARRHAGLLRNLAVVGATPLDAELPGDGPWATDVVKLQASRLWEAGRWAESLAVMDRLLAAPHRQRLDASQRLTWALRREAGRRHLGQAPDLDRIWARLPDLGPYDVRSGWALWLALRNHRGLPPIADDELDRDAAVFMGRAGKLYLSPEEFQQLGFDPELAAGLGGILLPREGLASHFGRHPAPPADGLFQGYWLRGQRRRDTSAARVEALAAMSGLKPGHRLDLWRRASEKHLLHGQWEPGLAALGHGLDLMDSRAGRGVRNRLREWTVQALALALAQDRPAMARRIEGLAREHLSARDHDAFAHDAAVLRQRLGTATAAEAANLRDRGEDTVRRGASPDVGLRPRLVLPDPVQWRHGLWRVWATWGLALMEGHTGLSPAGREYRDTLMFIQDCDDPGQRHTTATALAGRRLHGTVAAAPLLNHAWHRDLEQASGGEALPLPSPVPGVLEDAPWRTLAQKLRGHAILGAALAMGDDRGMIAAAVRLPAAGLPDRLYRLFWYPVPADPALRRALAATELPPELLLAIARNESLFEPAIRSRAGALGYMQIMPFHYHEPSGPPGDDHWSHPATSLAAGARILAGESRRFGGDPYRAVAAYNAGSGAVTRWNDQLGGVADRDLFWAWIGYPETRHYVLRVLRDREVYRWLLQDTP